MTIANAVHTVDIIDLGPALSLKGVRVRFTRNGEIFGQGEPAEYLYRVVSGAVRKMRFSSDGRRQILAFCLPGDVFGLELGDVHELSAEAVTDAEIIMVRRSLVEKAAFDDPRAARDWLKHASHKLTRARQHALILGLKSASERSAPFCSIFPSASYAVRISICRCLAPTLPTIWASPLKPSPVLSPIWSGVTPSTCQRLVTW